jgi:large subunit ribosomal protein L1
MKMGRETKRTREIAKVVDHDKSYTFEEAIELLKRCPSLKFDQSVDISLIMGVDPRKSDQQVRSTVSLPNGTGKKTIVLVFAKGEKVQEALDAGADYVGDQEYVDKVKSGWVDFDAVITTPDMMRSVGMLGKILGPRGLMPSPKSGTVTTDVGQMVQEIKAGKVEFKLDKHGVINNLVGKLSFDSALLKENILALVSAIVRAKPAAAKGHYIKSVSLSSTMGPGLKIDMREITS